MSKKLPAIWKGETGKAVSKAATRELAFQDKLANLRKVTGRPETVEIPMRCAVTGGRAVLTYTRMHAGEKFRLTESARIEGEAQSGIFGGLLDRKRPAIKFDVNEFLSAGRACPWCGNARFVVDCPNCHEATCGGTIITLKNGEEQHRCHPDCGHVTLLGPATHMTGGRPDRRGVLDGGQRPAIGRQEARLKLPGRTPRALPKSGPALLPGPKKR